MHAPCPKKCRNTSTRFDISKLREHAQGAQIRDCDIQEMFEFLAGDRDYVNFEEIKTLIDHVMGKAVVEEEED